MFVFVEPLTPPLLTLLMPLTLLLLELLLMPMPLAVPPLYTFFGLIELFVPPLTSPTLMLE